MVKSADSGATWSKPVAVSQLVDIIPVANTVFRNNSFPAATVPPNGNLYVTWSSMMSDSDVPPKPLASFVTENGSGSFRKNHTQLCSEKGDRSMGEATYDNCWIVGPCVLELSRTANAAVAQAVPTAAPSSVATAGECHTREFLHLCSSESCISFP